MPSSLAGAYQLRPNTQDKQAQPEVLPLRDVPMVDEQQPPTKIHSIAAHRSCSSAHTGDMKALRMLRDNAKVVGPNEQVT